MWSGKVQMNAVLCWKSGKFGIPFPTRADLIIILSKNSESFMINMSMCKCVASMFFQHSDYKVQSKNKMG